MKEIVETLCAFANISAMLPTEMILEKLKLAKQGVLTKAAALKFVENYEYVEHWH